jgi:AcrR family transcriptional regulator
MPSDPPAESCLAPRRRTQAERRDLSERLLVEATLAVVVERGVSGVTFEAIGQAAGVSRGLATQRFGSKQGLIDAVIDYLHQQRDAVLIADHVADMTPLDAILYYVDSHLKSLDANVGGRAYFMLLAGAVADASAMRAAFAASHERVRQWLAEGVDRGQADGSIRAELDANGVALMVGSLLLGVSIQWLVDPAMAIAPIRRASRDTLRASLAAEPKGTAR